MDIQIDDVFELKVDELKKILKKKRLSTVGKKSILQFRLVEFLEKDKKENIVEEEAVQIEEPVKNEEIHEETPEEPLNATFEVDKNEEISDSLLEELGVDRNLLEYSKRRNAASRNTPIEAIEVPKTPRRRSSRVTPAAKRTSQIMECDDSVVEITPSRKVESQKRGRFEAAHAKLESKMETLGERQKRIEKRHEELCENVPDVVKRLATPKSSRRPLKAVNSELKFNADVDLAKSDFQFGAVSVEKFKEVQKDPSVAGTFSVQPKKSSRIPRTDVKSLSRLQTRKRLEPVAPITPKTPKERKGYTPHRGKKVFIDTTQLTDREYKLAVEEGLLPGKSVKKMSPKQLRATELKKRRDDVLSLRRKLKL